MILVVQNGMQFLSYYIGMHMEASRLVVELLLLISYFQLELFANARVQNKTSLND